MTGGKNYIYFKFYCDIFKSKKYDLLIKKGQDHRSRGSVCGDIIIAVALMILNL